MHIHCLGVSHNTASVVIREKLAFSSHQLETALARLGCGGTSCNGEIRELVILSTCNRVEIYAVTDSPSHDALERFLAEVKNIPLETIRPHLFHLTAREAIHHLFRVAAGLDSVVLGEPQILGQVTAAYSVARQHAAAGGVLSRLFQQAIHAGKRARTETAISHNPASIASVAVKKIARIVADISTAKTVILGAGEMAELAVEALRKRGAQRIWVLNRTLERAQALADRWEATAATLEGLPEILSDTDILITSTGAPHQIIYPSLVEPVMERRPAQPLVIMDIAVPRDVDDQVNAIQGVSLFDMDTLSSELQDSLNKRAREIPLVEGIIAAEERIFLKYLRSLEVAPLIKELRRRADQIRRSELQKTIRRMPDLSPAELERIDAMTQAIVKKILHHPTIRLQAEAGGPSAANFANIARGLFGLEDTRLN